VGREGSAEAGREGWGLEAGREGGEAGRAGLEGSAEALPVKATAGPQRYSCCAKERALSSPHTKYVSAKCNGQVAPGRLSQARR
jgi:hypothetical protein